MRLIKKAAVHAYMAGYSSDTFSQAANRHANGFWGFAIISGAVWWLTSWTWALIPGALALYGAIQSVSSTLVAIELTRMSKPDSATGRAD